MKRTLLALLVVVMAAASADELKDAEQLLRRGATPEAAAIFTRLAEAGNSTAQLKLGELFLFGRGTAPDAARAQVLFAQAAKAGNPEAPAALRLIAERQARSAEIGYWLNGYDGAELHTGKFACGNLEFPPISQTKKQIRALNDKAEAWRACHNGFVANLNDQAPVGKRIPVDIEMLMTDAEIDQARKHLATVYAKISAEANALSAAAMANYTQWIAATDSFVMISDLEAKTWISNRNLKGIDEIANNSGHSRIALPAGNTPKK